MPNLTKNFTIMKFEQEWEKVNPKHVFLLRYFREALETSEVEWSMMTIRNLNKIREALEEKYAANSVVTYCAIIKAFLAQFVDTDLLPCGKDYKNALKVKKTPSEQITLNETEIALLENYKPKGDAEAEIKAQFLCEYYSLARASDIENMTDENIDLDRGLITYVSQKTKKTAVVPLHRNFLQCFHHRGKKRNRWHYNWVMKKICRKCGIDQPVKVFYHGKEQTLPKYELVGSHTARRSAATNLAKRGVPLPTIAKMMSHGQDIAMTQRYIWIDEIDLDDTGMNFFK